MIMKIKNIIKTQVINYKLSKVKFLMNKIKNK